MKFSNFVWRLCTIPTCAFIWYMNPTSASFMHQMCSSSNVVAVPNFVRIDGLDDGISEVLVQIQVDAYMFTLASMSRWCGRREITHRSIHFPGSRRATHLASNPLSWNRDEYHGCFEAVRNNTLPPIFSTLFSATTCSRAASEAGSNQSIESISCVISVQLPVHLDMNLQ